MTDDCRLSWWTRSPLSLWIAPALVVVYMFPALAAQRSPLKSSGAVNMSELQCCSSIRIATAPESGGAYCQRGVGVHGVSWWRDPVGLHVFVVHWQGQLHWSWHLLNLHWQEDDWGDWRLNQCKQSGRSLRFRYDRRRQSRLPGQGRDRRPRKGAQTEDLLCAGGCIGHCTVHTFEHFSFNSYACKRYFIRSTALGLLDLSNHKMFCYFVLFCNGKTIFFGDTVAQLRFRVCEVYVHVRTRSIISPQSQQYCTCFVSFQAKILHTYRSPGLPLIKAFQSSGTPSPFFSLVWESCWVVAFVRRKERLHVRPR